MKIRLQSGPAVAVFEAIEQFKEGVSGQTCCEQRDRHMTAAWAGPGSVAFVETAGGVASPGTPP